MDNVRTVVPGEASESDDDEIDNKNISDAEPLATVVLGEASESEEEEEVDTSQGSPQLPVLKVDTEGKGDNDEIIIVTTTTSPTFRTWEVSKPKYDTLLHKKLRERNAGFRRHIVDAIHQAYQTCGKDLHNTSQQLHKSQNIVMDISHNMRLLTNDLFYLEDKFDIITTCKLLPDIDIPLPGAASQ